LLVWHIKKKNCFAEKLFYDDVVTFFYYQSVCDIINCIIYVDVILKRNIEIMMLIALK